MEALTKSVNQTVIAVELNKNINGSEKIVLEFFGFYLNIETQTEIPGLYITLQSKGPIKLGNGTEPP